MLAGFLCGHSAAFLTVEGCIETDWRDAQLARLEFQKFPLRVVSTIEIADASMVASDNEVGAAVILARDSVEYGLARSRIAHRRRVQTEYGAARGQRTIKKRDIALKAHSSGHIFGFSFSYQRMQ